MVPRFARRFCWPWLLPLTAAQLLGWKELKDHETGRVYYLNQKTGETSWHPASLSPQLEGSCSSVCGKQTCGDWLLDKAQSFYTVKDHKVKCDLAHIAMLKACPKTCRHCEAQRACGNAPVFHCEATDEAEMRTWEESRLRWCCEHRSVACGVHQKLPSPYDCDLGQPDAWSVAKGSWCCSIEHKGCRFDCFKQLDAWEHTWSLKKRTWCCSHQKLGCIKPKEFDCTEGVLDAHHWSDVKRHYCCHMEGVGCVGHLKKHTPTHSSHDLYTCTGRDWPLDKIKWCCLTKKVGCKMLSSTTTTTMVQLYDCEAGLESFERGWSHRKKVWCCKTHHMGCAFDCRDHLSTWQVSWSAPQKTFCCATFKLGCVSLGLRPLQPKPGHFDCSSRSYSWSTEQQRWCCRNLGMGCELQALPYSTVVQHPAVKVEHVYHWHAAAPTFDCNDPSGLRSPTWSLKQRHFCCRDYGVGCSPQQPVAAVHLPPHVSRSKGTLRVFSADPYHCHAGREAEWSSEKRHFCCAKRKMGCEVRSVLVDHFRVDCNTYDEDWEKTWPAKQKRICCQKYGLGCPHWHPPQIHALHLSRESHKVTFDCDEDVPGLALSWPVAKRAFCCRYESKGCSDSAPPRYNCHSHQGAWSAAQTRWCCDVHHVGCRKEVTVPPKYDCSRDIDHWHQVWSVPKQRFCCDSLEMGCPKNRKWLQKLLVAPAAPATTTVAPQRDSYDCRAGVRHWKEGWSSRKANWCCAHQGVGCAFDCTKRFSSAEGHERQWCCQHRHVGCIQEKWAKLRGVAQLEGRGHIKLQICAFASVVLLSLFSLRLLRYRQREAMVAE